MNKKSTETDIYKGYVVETKTIEEFLTEADDKESVEVVKVDGLVFLYRSKTNQLYAVSEPKSLTKN